MEGGGRGVLEADCIPPSPWQNILGKIVKISVISLDNEQNELLVS